VQKAKVLVGFARRSDSARQVADLIRSDIVTNRFHGNLPYEWDLMEMYRSTRNVVRDAMSILQGQNLLRRVPGSGTFALAPGTSFSVDRKESRVAVKLDPNPGRTSDPKYAEKVVEGYPDGVYKCINAEIGECPEPVASRLQIPNGASVLYVEVAISLNNERQRLRSSWIPLDRVSGIEEGSLDCFMPDRIAGLMGAQTYSKNMLFEAVNADESAAQLLGIPVNGAVLMTERLNCVQGDVPVEFGFTRHRGDRTLIVSNL
jgi:GntR family transcriptional regulator